MNARVPWEPEQEVTPSTATSAEEMTSPEAEDTKAAADKTYNEARAAFSQLEDELGVNGETHPPLKDLKENMVVTLRHQDQPAEIETEGRLAGEKGVLMLRVDATREAIYDVLKNVVSTWEVPEEKPSSAPEPTDEQSAEGLQ